MITIPICSVCGGAKTKPFMVVKDHHHSKETFQLTQCSECEFLFTSPRPDTSAIGSYYSADNYISHTGGSTSLTDSLYRRVRSRALRSKCRTILELARSGSLLDIGCGTGAFLAEMATHSFQVFGIEPSDRARAHLPSHIAPFVTSSLSAPSRLYDVVTLWHVFEHVENPFLSLRDLPIKPGGYAFIAVPDRSSWDAKHYGDTWAAWDVPRHLSHFRPKDLKALFQRTGFQLVSSRRMWFDAPYIAMLSERYRGVGPVAALLKGAAIGAYSNLQALLSGRSTSSTLYIAKKAPGAK